MLQRARRRGSKYLNPVETQVGSVGALLKILGLYLTNKEERVPRRPLGPFRTDARVYARPPASGLRVTWMGHSSILIEIDGFRVLVDPVWEQRASPVQWSGPKRFFEAPLALADLPAIDVVLVSHDHYDHLGKGTIRKLAALPATAVAKWVTSAGVGKLLQGFGADSGRIVELDWTESLEIAGRAVEQQPAPTLTVTALPARHFSGRSLFNRFETLWSSFVLKGPRHKIYFGADSGLWEGFAEVGREFGPFDLTMLDTGAYHELWKDIHMGPDGVAEAYRAMGASGLLMPIHWGLFDLALHSWRQPIIRMTELADELGLRLWSPEPGLPTEVVAGVEHRSQWWVA